MNEFKMEDVLIDIFRVGQSESYRMTHKPSGNVVQGIGTPRINNKQKLDLMDKLIETVKNDTSFQGKQNP